MDKAIGKKIWSIVAGRIPEKSNAPEQSLISHDKIAVLNTDPQQKASIEITIFYENQQPVGKFQLEVKPSRLRKVRFNDLVDPWPIPLEKNYGCLIESNTPVIVQYSRIDTSSAVHAKMGSIAFAVE